MSNNTIWQVIHVLCILAHGGLIITAFIAFVVVGFLSFSDFDHRHLDKSSDRDMSVHILPWAAFGIVSPLSSDYPGCLSSSFGSNPFHASSNKLSDILEKRNLETFWE